MLCKTLVSGIPNIAAPVRLASGVLIILVGLQLAFGCRILAPLESAGAKIWNRIAPAMIATVISASKLAQFMSGKRLGVGLLIVLLGLATIAMPVMKFMSSNGQMDHSQHGRMLQDE